MILKKTGTIVVNDCNVRFTDGGRWLVSQKGIFMGEVDTLNEVASFIEQHHKEVTDRATRLNLEAAEKAASNYTDLSMRQGEGMGLDPNH